MAEATNNITINNGGTGSVQFGRPKFDFDGGAATFIGIQILAGLVTIFTLGIAYPYALVLLERWRCTHSLIDGRRLKFYGTGIGLFGHWIKWFLLSIITLGIYLFWVQPRLQKWIWENTNFAD